MTKRKKLAPQSRGVRTSALLPRELATRLQEMAARALHNLDTASVFVGMTDARGYGGAARLEFMLQLGYCLLHDKPIILPVPHGVDVPTKLAAVADRIVRYDPNDLNTLELAIRQAFTELGVVPQ